MCKYLAIADINVADMCVKCIVRLFVKDELVVRIYL